MRHYVPEEPIQDPAAREQNYRAAHKRVVRGLIDHGLTEVDRMTQIVTGPEPAEYSYRRFIYPPQPSVKLEDYPVARDDSYDGETGAHHVGEQRAASFDPRIVSQYVEVRYVSTFDMDGPSVAVSFTDKDGQPEAPQYPAYVAVGVAFDGPSLARAS